MKKAFTLSEVLITLAIIGLISALTVPSFVKNYQRKLCVSQLEKIYAQLTDAIQTAMEDELANQSFTEASGHSKMNINWNDGGAIEPSFENSTAGLKSNTSPEAGAVYLLNNYLKIASRNCTDKAKINNEGTCLTVKSSGEISGYKNWAGTDVSNNLGFKNTTYCVQTITGAVVCITDRFNVFVDVNGRSEPNITGFDAFLMKINKTTGELTDFSNDETKCNTETPWAAGCLAKIMNAGWEIK